jgi:hypothetical protein
VRLAVTSDISPCLAPIEVDEPDEHARVSFAALHLDCIAAAKQGLHNAIIGYTPAESAGSTPPTNRK